MNSLLWLLFQQNKILKNQNKLIAVQNSQVDNQNQLIESQRRSSLMFVYGSILEQINYDLGLNTKSRQLSPQTIGNIISLSRGLRPYRFLEDSTLIKKPLSPERGQLLSTLLSSDINDESLAEIFSKADFSYSDLREFDLQNVSCIGCNLQNAEIHGADLSFSDFSGANLTNACLNHSIIVNTKFDYANLSNSKFDECTFFDSTSFNMAIISRIDWFDQIAQTGFNKINTFNSVGEKHVIDTSRFTEFNKKGVSRYGFRVYNLDNRLHVNEKIIRKRKTFTEEEIKQLNESIMNNSVLRE